MSKAIAHYINQTMAYANVSQSEEPALRAELEDHLLSKISELEEKGVLREDAIFQAIEENGKPDVVGYGLRKFRWIDIRSRGTARGFVAIGPRAVGVFAFGGFATGVFSFGGFSVGLFGIGGFCLSLLFGWGGFVLAPLGLAYGGFAVGLFASGGFAVGLISFGATALGLYAQGAVTFSYWEYVEAPAWIQAIISWMPSKDTFVQWFNIINLALVAGFLGVLFPMLYLQNREERRLKCSLKECRE